jgi:outer membrane protein OmpA-like peptidoglycan-associated protein
LDIASLEQAGLPDGGSKVVVILGSGQQLTTAPTKLPAGLNGRTLIVSGFSGNDDYEAAWQADMLEAGASMAMSLDGTDGSSQLANAVRISLSGTAAETVTNISFARGQSSFTEAAFPRLHKLLIILTRKSQQVTATINGYADDLLTREQNVKLSQERAKAISDWLIANGVASNRLKAVGHGDSNLIPPSSTHAEELNRSVAVIVDPSSSAAFGQP